MRYPPKKQAWKRERKKKGRSYEKTDKNAGTDCIQKPLWHGEFLDSGATTCRRIYLPDWKLIEQIYLHGIFVPIPILYSEISCLNYHTDCLLVYNFHSKYNCNTKFYYQRASTYIRVRENIIIRSRYKILWFWCGCWSGIALSRIVVIYRERQIKSRLKQTANIFTYANLYELRNNYRIANELQLFFRPTWLHTKLIRTESRRKKSWQDIWAIM